MRTLLVALVLVGGCAPYAKLVPYAPTDTEAPVGLADDDLTVAAARVLFSHGFRVDPVSTLNHTGIVVTTWFDVEPRRDDGPARRHAVRVVAREGTLTIAIDCSELAVRPVWFACADDQRNASVVQQVADLGGKILAEADRRAARRKAGRGK